MFDPIKASANIKQSYIDYISTTFHFANPHYQRQLLAALDKSGEIAKGPYLDVSGSFQSGRSIRELIDEGLASRLFADLEDGADKEKELKIFRPLYSHQQESLLRADGSNNLVITTGTGSGKTECFMLPILQALLKEKEAGTLDDSVRTIIIYPMNALANDQMKRLRKILSTFQDITFGIYNSNTEHDQKKAEAKYRDINREAPLKNEAISRAMMQQKPPHILITNYSMLEYMMLRPKDDKVFSGAKLRYIVLDEAHIYRGATGMETSILMRRLRARIQSPSVRYILTSATLGGKDADDDIVAFAEELCNAPFQAANIIRAKEVPVHMLERREIPLALFEELYREQKSAGEVLRDYGADFAPDGDEQEKLYELMLRCELFEKLRAAATSPKTVNRLAGEIGVQTHELVQLIAASAKAVKNGTSLIKSRYHFFVRALEGSFVSLTGRRELFLTRQEYDADDNAVFECAICEDCGRLAIVGIQEGARLVLANDSYDEKTEYFLVKDDSDGDYFQSDEDDQDDEEGVGQTAASDERDFVLCPVCGAIGLESMSKRGALCKHNPGGWLRLKQAKKRKNGNFACPTCEFGNFRRFYLGYDAATAVIGTALYEELPDCEVEFANADAPEEKLGLFGVVKTPKTKTAPKSRQFLAFSDSRADAAFFASYMDKSYQEFLRRRGLWQVCDKLMREGRRRVTARDMIGELARFYEKNRSFAELGHEAEAQTSICRKHAYIAVINELVSSRRSSGLVQLGKLAFLYAPKEEERRHRWDDAAVPTIEGLMPSPDSAARDTQALLTLLMTDAVFAGALDAGDEFDLKEEEREYLFYAPKPKKIVKMQTEKAKSYLSGWLPKSRTGQKKTFFFNTRMARVKRALNMSDEKAWELLESFWENVLGFVEEREYALKIQDFDILLFGEGAQSDDGARLYRCETCGRVTAFNCQDKCVNIKCKGTLAAFDPAAFYRNNHYAKLYSVGHMAPLYIKEHTAQLSRDHAEDYQKKFVEKKINALSSSTTFEMGVDVGSLETVFLRDVPPTPANYVQRAGRAGRSLQSAAYALTYAKLSSHDFTYFKTPEDMISGKIKAPKFKLENEKVVRRHINAVALSAFFNTHEDVYKGNDQSVLLNYDGYEKLKAFLEEKPPHLKQLLLDSIPGANAFGVDDWSWTEQLIGENGLLELAVRDFRRTVKLLENEWNSRRRSGEPGVDACARRLREFRGDTSKNEPRRGLIDFLVRNNVLPKYGFPIDTVELLPDATNIGDKNRPQMQRDLQLAVAEYAPGAEIVADGKLYTSRYIRKLQSGNTHNWEYGFYAKCRDCETVNFYKDNATRASRACISCGSTISKLAWHATLEPRRGFIAERPEPVRMRKPDRVYKTDDHYIGNPREEATKKLQFAVNGKRLAVEYTTNDSLVVLTRTRFRVCPLCGYAVGEGEAKSFEIPHKNAHGGNCALDDKTKAREYYLSHDFKTDVARLTFEDAGASDYGTILSALFALLEAISKELSIERNDIKGCLFRKKLGDDSLVYSAVLYDAAAGGAGHIRRIVTQSGDVLARVIRRAVSLMETCDCEPSCYKCLRNYYNQKVHAWLNRKAAGGFLREYLGDMEIIPDTLAAAPAAGQDPDVVVTESTPLRGHFQEWPGLESYFADCEGLIDLLHTLRIPLADSYDAELRVDGAYISALLLWESKKIAICEEEVPDTRQRALLAAGWRCAALPGLNADWLHEAFGGVPVG